MNHLTRLNRDIKYKYRQPFYKESEDFKEAFGSLDLWVYNRLSLIRYTIFLSNYFTEISTKRTIIKIKVKKKKYYLKFTVPLRMNENILKHVAYCLPPPRVISSLTGYVLVYSFNHFFFKLPFDPNNPNFSYSFYPYVTRFDVKDLPKY